MIKKTMIILLLILPLLSCEIFINGNNDIYKHKYEYEYITGFLRPSAFFDGVDVEPITDDYGIPIYDGVYHPSTIATYGINLFFNYYHNKNESDKVKLLQVADWLLENAEPYRNSVVWRIPFDYPGFHQQAPWSSGLTNAWGALALLYASSLSQEKKDAYISTSIKAINYLFIPLENGGCLSNWEDGSIWFEEYPSLEHTSRVLNGFIFILDVLDKFYEYLGIVEHLDYLDKGLDSLYNKIHLYDRDYGSVYDALSCVNKLGTNYHTLHWKQLSWCYVKTGETKFLDYAKKWYELEEQGPNSISVNHSVDIVAHGPDRLSDNIYWYGYWSSNQFPECVLIDLGKNGYTYGINIFSLSESANPNSVTVEYYNDIKMAWVVLKNNIDYSIRKTGSNSTGNSVTYIYTIRFTKLISMSKIRLTYPSPLYGATVSIREIGIWKDMLHEYSQELERMKNILVW